MEKEKSNMDDPIEAVCKYGCGTKKTLSFRKLKNKWPHCNVCNQPMKVTVPNAVSVIHPTD